MSISMPRDSSSTEPFIGICEPRTYLVEMLDSIRRQEQAVALSKVRYLQLAERYGMSVVEMAEAVGMSDSGVRSILARAKSGPTEADGVPA